MVGAWLSPSPGHEALAVVVLHKGVQLVFHLCPELGAALLRIVVALCRLAGEHGAVGEARDVAAIGYRAVIIGGLVAVVAVLRIGVRAEDVGCIDFRNEGEDFLKAGTVLQQHQRFLHLGDEVFAPVYRDAAERFNSHLHLWNELNLWALAIIALIGIAM